MVVRTVPLWNGILSCPCQGGDRARPSGARLDGTADADAGFERQLAEFDPALPRFCASNRVR